MPDITMCHGGDCLIKETCYRYKDIPCEYRQSYWVDPPYDKSKTSDDFPDFFHLYMVSSPDKICSNVFKYCGSYWHYK